MSASPLLSSFLDQCLPYFFFLNCSLNWNLKEVGDYYIVIGREVTGSNLCIKKNTVNEDKIITWFFVEVHGNISEI